MSKRKIAAGPGASSLILIAVVLALTVLAVLTMIAARNDQALAVRTAETRQEAYGLFADGERSLAKLDGVLAECLAAKPADGEALLAAAEKMLPEGMTLEGDTVSWTEQRGLRQLECAVRINPPGAEKRTEWVRHRLGEEDIWDEDAWNDWDDSWTEDADPEETEEEEADAGEDGETSEEMTEEDAGE